MSDRPLHDFIDMEAYDVVSGDVYRELLATNTRLREALTHYANEDHWDETTAPVEVNTAGYLSFEYDGGHEFPWEVARAALAQDTEQESA